MPTNDDTPKIETLSGNEDLTSAEASTATNVQRLDLIQVYDQSGQKHKAITVQELGEALGLTFS